MLRPENMKVANTSGVESLLTGEGILTVLVLLPNLNLCRWAGRKFRRR